MITSTRNPRVADAAKLGKRGIREQRRRFLVEGPQAVAEAIEAGAVEALFHVAGSRGRVPEVVAAAQRSGIDVVAVSGAVMEHLTSAVTPQGVVAVSRFVDAELEAVPGEGVVPVLVAVRDPGNAGAILRSADAAGAAGVVFTETSVDVYNAKTVRASAGSLFHLPVVREVAASAAVGALRERGAQVLAAAADGDVDVYDTDLTRPTALLLGNEAWGLAPEARALADASVRVPIRGKAESLNLAAAAALLLFEAARQRALRPSSAPPGADLSRLISGAAHDLRLPITALKGFAATLADRWDRFPDDARRQMVEGMLLDIERVSAFTTSIVDAARLERDAFEVSAERRDVGEAMRSVAELFERSPDYPEVRVAGNAMATVDRERLQSLLLALCDGALWWGQDGPIEISARPEEGVAVVEVRRAGSALSAREAEGMFGPPGTEGARVGLHVARRIAEALGGSLTAEGGDAVAFRLTLPG